MSFRKHIYPVLLVLLVVSFVFGCAGLRNYGKIRPTSGPSEKMTVDELKENWQDYTIYYAGATIEHASALMFDPKNDDRVLVGDYWTKVKDQETVEYLINKIQRYVKYNSRVWSILSPDDQFFGYLVLPVRILWGDWNRSRRAPDSHVIIKVIDEKTLYVYGLHSSGSYARR